MMTVILFTVLNRMHRSISLLHQILSRVLVFMTGVLKLLYVFREPIKSLSSKPDKVCQLVLSSWNAETGQVPKFFSKVNCSDIMII